jgi:hypothetical protein
MPAAISSLTKIYVPKKCNNCQNRPFPFIFSGRMVVDAAVGPWLRIRLDDGQHGWTAAESKGDRCIWPEVPLVHRKLLAQPAPKRAKTMASGFFGRKTLRSPSPVDGTWSPSTSTSPVGTPLTGATGGGGGPQQFARFQWQQSRGLLLSEQYLTVLERRRATLRTKDLSADPTLLLEWVELIRELDLVVRYVTTLRRNPPVQASRVSRAFCSFFGLFVCCLDLVPSPFVCADTQSYPLALRFSLSL